MSGTTICKTMALKTMCKKFFLKDDLKMYNKLSGTTWLQKNTIFHNLKKLSVTIICKKMIRNN